MLQPTYTISRVFKRDRETVSEDLRCPKRLGEGAPSLGGLLLRHALEFSIAEAAGPEGGVAGSASLALYTVGISNNPFLGKHVILCMSLAICTKCM